MSGERIASHFSGEVELREGSPEPAARGLKVSPHGPLPTGTVTFAFTDIEGSTKRWEREPVAMQAALLRHDELMRSSIAQHGGAVFKTIGDAFCAAFSKPVDAVAAALEVQRRLAAEEFFAVGALRVRVALHTGTADERDGDYFGPTVNRVARLLAIGHGGQVLVSGTTRGLIDGALPPGATLRDLGEHRLKDLAHPEHVYQLEAPGLEKQFPQLQSLETLLNNLPLQISNLLARDDLVEAIAALVGRQRAVTLVGPGGIGKTRVALKVAAHLTDGSLGGVWFVELASLSDPALVAGEISSVLQIRDAGDRPIRETLLNFMKKRHLLLVLDNCEHLAAEVASIVSAILRSAPHVHVLATSREPLNVGGETAYRIPPLPVPPAGGERNAGAAMQYGSVMLFVERARAANPNFALTDENAQVVGEICRRLDGIALAIELAAARVRALSIQNLAQRLDERFRILTGGDRNALPRQQTMRALLDWSYDLLSPTEQTLFCRLGIFAGGWTLEAAEAVCSGNGAGRAAALEVGDVLDALSSLVDKSLAIADLEGAPRYHMLETMREYAIEKIEESGERAALSERRARWLTTFLVRTHDAFREKRLERWLSEIEPETENVREALHWAFGSDGDVELGSRIVSATSELWYDRGLFGEGRRWVSTALARLDETQHPALTARMWSVMARLSNGKQSADACRRSVTLYEFAGELGPAAVALLDLTLHETHLGHLEDADGASRRAVDMLRALGWEGSTKHAFALEARAHVERLAAHVDESKRLYDEAIEMYAANGAESEAAIVRHNLAELLADTGDFQGALEAAESAAATLQRLAVKGGARQTRINAAGYCIVLGDFERGAAFARDGLELSLRADDTIYIWTAVQHLAAVEAVRNDVERAALLLGGVDAYLKLEGLERFGAERATYEILMAALRKRLTDAQITALGVKGAQLSQDEAAAQALRVGVG